MKLGYLIQEQTNQKQLIPTPGRTSIESSSNRHWRELRSQLKNRRKKFDTLCLCLGEHLINQPLTGTGKNRHHNSKADRRNMKPYARARVNI